MVTTPTNQMKVTDTKIYKCLWDAVAGPEYRLPSQVSLCTPSFCQSYPNSLHCREFSHINPKGALGDWGALSHPEPLSTDVSIQDQACGLLSLCLGFLNPQPSQHPGAKSQHSTALTGASHCSLLFSCNPHQQPRQDGTSIFIFQRAG